MPKLNPAVDEYIRHQAPFARPILTKIRYLFHDACPALEEKIKWGVPSFEYKGMLGGMAAFKRHVAWGLWKASLLNDPRKIMHDKASSAMSAGKPTTVDDLPKDKHILELIRQAVELNERGVKLPQRSNARRKPPPKVPGDFAAALKKNAKAFAAFSAFAPSHKREYVEWITEAKRDATRQKRLAQAIEWLAEGKPRNWKYMKSYP